MSIHTNNRLAPLSVDCSCVVDTRVWMEKACYDRLSATSPQSTGPTTTTTH